MQLSTEEGEDVWFHMTTVQSAAEKDSPKTPAATPVRVRSLTVETGPPSDFSGDEDNSDDSDATSSSSGGGSPQSSTPLRRARQSKTEFRQQKGARTAYVRLR